MTGSIRNTDLIDAVTKDKDPVVQTALDEWCKILKTIPGWNLGKNTMSCYINDATPAGLSDAIIQAVQKAVDLFAK